MMLCTQKHCFKRPEAHLGAKVPWNLSDEAQGEAHASSKRSTNSKNKYNILQKVIKSPVTSPNIMKQIHACKVFKVKTSHIITENIQMIKYHYHILTKQQHIGYSHTS